ncbi:hypothetical protein QTO34_012468 [Cnephaeus nilssonii]|uniref:Uncharacterized protein n=1 Tax=Cnephaeus nilssonii TaxID=3371016 RepID=A0AA40HB70_CNENI|nr:hypothetical protein QTO34_012468 [Eptesicus nilssonii]
MSLRVWSLGLGRRWYLVGKFLLTFVEHCSQRVPVGCGLLNKHPAAEPPWVSPLLPARCVYESPVTAPSREILVFVFYMRHTTWKITIFKT